MPNVYRLWQSGVKFGNHFNAGNMCTPSRGVLITGLYTQQTWLTQTIRAAPYARAAIQPSLNSAFPTYGKLLRQAGYRTPYAGKWHVSILDPEPGRLEAFGFDSLMYPDPAGANLQGAVGDETNGYPNDADIADQAANWLANHSSGGPWCLTVALMNPHDYQFFWAGTEFEKYNPLFEGTGRQPFIYYSSYQGTDYPPVVDPEANPFRWPPSYGYPLVPPNWETKASLANKPTTQTFQHTFLSAVWGGVSEHQGQYWYSVEPYPNPKGASQLDPLGIAVAPFGYWQRGMDCYTQALSMVDERVGAVLNALAPDVAANTVIVFTADHGEYAGAHGLIAGKAGSVYDEAYHIPLIVTCPPGLFAADTDTIRTELTSSVDVMSLLVSLGNYGTRGWITPELAQPYASRLDMIPMLGSAAAAGRPYVLLVTDEQIADVYNYNDSPAHIVGLRTKDAKLGVYANWYDRTTDIDPASIQTEYYDYATERGRLELDSAPGSDGAQAMMAQLFNDIIPNELHAPLAPNLRQEQLRAKIRYLAFVASLDGMTPRDLGF